MYIILLYIHIHTYGKLVASSPTNKIRMECRTTGGFNMEFCHEKIWRMEDLDNQHLEEKCHPEPPTVTNRSRRSPDAN